MKTRSLFILSLLVLVLYSCKKDAEPNNFKFTSISGEKVSTTSGWIGFIWTDAQNTNWNIVVRNPDGSIRNSLNSGATDITVNNLGLDTTFTFGVTGGSKPSQNGSFSARIGTMGDVLITNIKP